MIRIRIRGSPQLESSIMDEANRLAVGPMGFSGRTSLIGCKIGALNRLPASFFVSIAYDCWAFRRLGVRLTRRPGAITVVAVPRGTLPPNRCSRPRPWLPDSRGPDARFRSGANHRRQVRSLRVGDVVLISGRVYTGRDAVHAHLMKHDPPVDLQRGRPYHCGPVVVKEQEPASPKPSAEALGSPKPKGEGGGWRVTAAGPTTSIREEPYQADIIRKYGVRVVIGKGGMGDKTLAGLKNQARCISMPSAAQPSSTPAASSESKASPDGVRNAGSDVAPAGRDFPAIVTMDAHGGSLHKEVEEQSGRVLAGL